ADEVAGRRPEGDLPRHAERLVSHRPYEDCTLGRRGADRRARDRGPELDLRDGAAREREAGRARGEADGRRALAEALDPDPHGDRPARDVADDERLAGLPAGAGGSAEREARRLDRELGDGGGARVDEAGSLRRDRL